MLFSCISEFRDRCSRDDQEMSRGLGVDVLKGNTLHTRKQKRLINLEQQLSANRLHPQHTVGRRFASFTWSSSWMKVAGISFRRIFPKMVSPPSAAILHLWEARLSSQSRSHTPYLRHRIWGTRPAIDPLLTCLSLDFDDPLPTPPWWQQCDSYSIIHVCRFFYFAHNGTIIHETII